MTISNISNQPVWAEEQCSPSKSILVNEDESQIRVAWKLEERWNGDIYLADDGKSIVQDTVYSKKRWFNPMVHFANEGIVDLEDNFFVLMSLERENTYKRFLEQTPRVNPGPSDPPDDGIVVVRREMFRFPFPVSYVLQSRNGNPEPSIVIDSNDEIGDWVIGYLQIGSKDC